MQILGIKLNNQETFSNSISSIVNYLGSVFYL